jgi:hypothetical protein
MGFKFYTIFGSHPVVVKLYFIFIHKLSILF